MNKERKRRGDTRERLRRAEVEERRGSGEERLRRGEVEERRS